MLLSTLFNIMDPSDTKLANFWELGPGIYRKTTRNPPETGKIRQNAQSGPMRSTIRPDSDVFELRYGFLMLKTLT